MSAYRMPQLTELRRSDDDWTGVTSTAERKKRQNRLHQRAYRYSENSITKEEPEQVLAALDACSQSTRYPDIPGEGSLLLTSSVQIAKTLALIRKAYEDYTLNAPQPAYLNQLICLNALNAFAKNAVSLGFAVEGLCHDEAISPFNLCGPHAPTKLISPPSPLNLQPTALQLAVIHHPWIDLFPVPRMRDNILSGLVAGLFDEDELCCDILEIDNKSEKPRLIVWGESWDIYAWEASVPFLRKWGWLVHGCPEILETTNNWRAKRGEKALSFQLE
ncbi:hypothetical protein F5884DRAFT_857245 [Xylogone sp. PMI_703]|nr:hypothetical protein F5884DRAFT_857245 [Xylogone sp. PMI_703]